MKLTIPLFSPSSTFRSEELEPLLPDSGEGSSTPSGILHQKQCKATEGSSFLRTVRTVLTAIASTPAWLFQKIVSAGQSIYDRMVRSFSPTRRYSPPAANAEPTSPDPLAADRHVQITTVPTHNPADQSWIDKKNSRQLRLAIPEPPQLQANPGERKLPIPINIDPLAPQAPDSGIDSNSTSASRAESDVTALTDVHLDFPEPIPPGSDSSDGGYDSPLPDKQIDITPLENSEDELEDFHDDLLKAPEETSIQDDRSIMLKSRVPVFLPPSPPVDEVEIASVQATMSQCQNDLKALIEHIQMRFLSEGSDKQAVQPHLTLFETKKLKTLRSYFKQQISDDKRYDPLRQAMTRLEADFKGLNDYIDTAVLHDFRSPSNYLKQVDLHQKVVDKLPDSFKGKQQAMEVIQKYRAIPSANGCTDGCVQNAVSLLIQLQNKLKQIGKNNGITPAAFDQALIDELSKDSSTFASELYVYKEDGWHKVRFTYTPAADMRFHGPSADTPMNDRDPFKHPYGGTFQPSMLRDTKHAVNMLGYTMEVDDEVVTRRIRVGCPLAYKAKGEAQKAGTNDRLDEILTATLVHCQPEALEQAASNPDHVIELDLAYLNLMSPDHLRDGLLAKLMDQDNEKEWVKKLDNYLDSMINTPRELTITQSNGQPLTVKVKATPHMFVLPCNMLALKPWLARHANTWKSVITINRKALTRLVGSADSHQGMLADKLPGLSQDEQTRARALADELWGMVNTGLQRASMEKGPFEFSLKLKALLRLLKMPEFTGCKSNKDRTGISEAHDQAALLQEKLGGGPLMVEHCLVFGGHMMVQMRNTGLPGYRLDSTPGARLNKQCYQAIQRSENVNCPRQQKNLKPEWINSVHLPHMKPLMPSMIQVC